MPQITVDTGVEKLLKIINDMSKDDLKTLSIILTKEDKGLKEKEKY